MSRQILIWYDGSEGAERAVDTAAALLAPGDVVVLTVAPSGATPEAVVATHAGK